MSDAATNSAHRGKKPAGDHRRPGGFGMPGRKFSVKRRSRFVRLLAVAMLTSLLPAAVPSAASEDSVDTSTSTGVKVVGHSDLGGEGLNGHVAVLGNFAYVGYGTNGGFASLWNKTPTCAPATAGTDIGTVKVVSLENPEAPTIVSRIKVGEGHTIARDVAAIRVNGSPIPGAFIGDLLAVATEKCNANRAGLVGVNFYDVTNPELPVLLGRDDRGGDVVVRQVSLAQRPDGRVFAFEAMQGSSGMKVVDASVPAVPKTVATFPQGQFPVFSTRECRPFNYTQGVSTNATGSRAYVAQADEGLYVLDTANPAPNIDPTNTVSPVVPPVLSHTQYPANEEGNSFRFVPNAAETKAVATDEDLTPAKTTLTISTTSAAKVAEHPGAKRGVFRGCEALWGAPLYKREVPSLPNKEVVFVPNGGCVIAEGTDLTNKIALTDRGGQAPPGATVCGFDEKARAAQSRGALAVLVANTATDHHNQGGTGILFSADSVRPVNADVAIPMVMVTKELRDAVAAAIEKEEGPIIGTLTDNPDTWGALRVFDLAGPPPHPRVSTFNAPHTNVLTPGDGLYYAVNAAWEGDHALVAWMSDGLRVVDLTNPAAPKGRASFVPPATSDPTGNFGTVPLVVDVAKFGSRVVVTDINGGLYVLDVAMSSAECTPDGWKKFGFANAADCMKIFQ